MSQVPQHNRHSHPLQCWPIGQSCNMYYAALQCRILQIPGLAPSSSLSSIFFLGSYPFPAESCTTLQCS